MRFALLLKNSNDTSLHDVIRLSLHMPITVIVFSRRECADLVSSYLYMQLVATGLLSSISSIERVKWDTSFLLACVLASSFRYRIADLRSIASMLSYILVHRQQW